jgi:hypothetical protein
MKPPEPNSKNKKIPCAPRAYPRELQEIPRTLVLVDSFLCSQCGSRYVYLGGFGNQIGRRPNRGVRPTGKKNPCLAI